jgi:hypothetical protein
MMYLVVEDAVYRHQIAGPFPDLDAAIAFATDLAIEDRDGHHDYDIYALDPDGPHILGDRFPNPTAGAWPPTGTVGYPIDHVGSKRDPDAMVGWFPYPETRWKDDS